MKDTRKCAKSRQLPRGGYLHKDRVELKSSAGVPIITSMSENKESNDNEYGVGLLEKILEPDNLNLAYKKVKVNKGSSGVDGMMVDSLRKFLKQNGAKIRQSILEGTYKPSPVQRVEIPKPDGGKRLLGIPTVSANCTEVQYPFGKCHNNTSFSSTKWSKL